MTQLYESTIAQSLYRKQLTDLVKFGQHVDVRGRNTKEMLDVVTEIREPWHSCIIIPSRRWNPWIAMSEGLWILAGRDDIKPLLSYNANIKDYSDDGVSLYGAYGLRLKDQIQGVIDRLTSDPSDRRSVLSIWRPEDLVAKTKDPPCNDMVMFKLRNGYLNMTVINRSNDIHWGLYAVNFPTFSLLLNYMAARLGVTVGTQTHLSNSLHVYTDDKRATAITDRMMRDNSYLMYPNHGLAFGNKELEGEHAAFADMCSGVIDNGLPYLDLPPFLQFATKFLACYRNKAWYTFTDYEKERFADWIAAAHMWVQQTGAEWNG